MAELRIHTCPREKERSLCEELGRVFPKSRHRVLAQGFVETVMDEHESRAVACLALASQCLPDAVFAQAESISSWAETVRKVVAERLDPEKPRWRLHVFCVEARGSDVRQRRCDLIRKRAAEKILETNRRLAKKRASEDQPRSSEEEWLVQVALVTPESGYISVAPPAIRERLRRCISPFQGGFVEVKEDKAPPSRAYLKLLEAESRMNRRIASGQTCVDLGAAPGGWSYVALSRGAVVTAVDRSPLAPEMASRPGLTFVRGNGFSFAPKKPVDWLLCDIVAFPERTLDLLNAWIERDLCRFFVVTIKFRGTSDYPLLERFKRLLETGAFEFLLRSLDRNKNEVTAMGWRNLSG